ncbi:MAG: AmmeMemoRadiSam system protein B [Thermodesulfobacteriota bacterium]|nr:AmmeMemoRadiSam system protein B [Thermodesulfobacteriota bacterium]
MKVRKSMLAGSWYPAGASECEREINNFLNDATVSPSSKNKLTGGIVPHAGWYYSGSIACNVINYLKKGDSPDVFVIFGMHLGHESPCYIMKEGIWETPFGDIQIEKEIAGELVERFNFNVETPEYFTEDNTIELQLPFIKYLFGDVKIVPVGVPPAKKSLEIGRAAADISTKLGLNIKVIGSTDLTHYGLNYGFMPEGTGHSAVDWVRKVNDKKIIEIMLEMDPDKVISEALKHQNACCSGAAATAIAAAKQLGADHADAIVYATSYDKRPSDSFVGYAGIVF